MRENLFPPSRHIVPLTFVAFMNLARFELLVLACCKVVRIGKRVQPDISKARQQVNIDGPACNKTDKQCRTRMAITARLPDG